MLYSVPVELSAGFVKFPTLAGMKPPIGEAASWSRTVTKLLCAVPCELILLGQNMLQQKQDCAYG